MRTVLTTTSTGIQIGCLHKPKQHHDKDAIRLQNALLGNKTPIDWDGIFIVMVVAAIALAIIFSH